MQPLTEYITESLNQGFVIIKPGFLEHEDEIREEMVKRGLFINSTCRKHLTLDEAKTLYSLHKDKDFYDDLCEYMSSGESIAFITRGQHTTKNTIKIKDMMRGKYGEGEMRNVMHSSDSLKNAVVETSVYF